MTRNDWPNGADIHTALLAVRHRMSARQLRLLACVCARRDWRLLRSEASRRAVALAERYSDRHVNDDRLSSAYTDALKAISRRRDGAEIAAATVATIAASRLHERYEVEALAAALGELSRWVSTLNECQLVPVLGELLRPRDLSTFPAHYGTPDVLALAHQAYHERDWSVLPVLGDALEDAGCPWPDVLEHCRAPGRHYRGCWVELILGHE
jgi:hypothetical protein